MNKFSFIALGLAATLGVSLLLIQPSCNSTKIEDMTEQQSKELNTWVYLTTKVAASHLIAENKISASDAALASNAIQAVTTGQVVDMSQSLITDSLKKVGLKNDEITLALLVIETEISRHGGFQYVNNNGTLTLGTHTKELLTTVSQALVDSVPPKNN